MNNKIEVSNLTVKYNKFVAVNNITFNVDEGEVVGFLGSNGAGKTTTLSVLAGIAPYSSGKVVIAGTPQTSYKNMGIIKENVGYCPDVGGLIAGATPLEHIRLMATLRKDRKLYTKGLELLERLDLTQFANTSSVNFSHGMQRRLSVLLATLGAKKALILDEPYDGVDPFGVEAINEIIDDASRQGQCVILSTHLHDLLVDSTDRINIMYKGEIIDTGNSESYEGKEGKEKYAQLLKSRKGSTR